MLIELKKIRNCKLYFENKGGLIDFESIIEFVGNYADQNHHEKEEKLLFKAMVDELDSPSEKLVKYGMYVERDLGRLFVLDLEKHLVEPRQVMLRQSLIILQMRYLIHTY